MTRERRKILKKYKNEFVSEFYSFVERENINLNDYVKRISPCYKEYSLETLIETDPWYMFNSVIDYSVKEYNYWHPLHIKWMHYLTEKYGLTH